MSPVDEINLRAERREAIYDLVASLGYPVAKIARIFGMSRCKVQTALRREKRTAEYIVKQALEIAPLTFIRNNALIERLRSPDGRPH